MRASVLLLLLAASGALAHEPARIGPRSFDVTAFAGWQLNGDATLKGGELRIDDSATYGAAIDWRFHRAGSLEAMWEYAKTTQQFRSFSAHSPSSKPFDVATHYFQVGAMHRRNLGTRLEPFIGFTLGAALCAPGKIPLTDGSTLDARDTWRFAMSIVLGMKTWISPNVGLHFATRVFAPVVFTEGQIYAGTGGAGMGVPASIPFLQFGFTAGLTFGK
ncbi:MAG: hypothetical protein ACJ78X_03330 [Myxococcales bacterium]